MNVSVLGTGPLADATRKHCDRFFPKTDAPLDIIWVCSEMLIPRTDSAIILISWPVPPGRMKSYQELHPNIVFAYAPENVRTAHAEQDMLNQDRVICGIKKPDDRLIHLFAPFTNNVLFVSIETAEMVKHALNGFLALCVAYANELGQLCQSTGADMNHVTYALRSDSRVGMQAYLDSGRPYGCHLEREIDNLISIKNTTLISSIKRSNDEAK